ncbi:MAG TPA: alpha-L-arabinofuranosidase C-terminal domain-containing protein [Balneolaceae bacterium]|nr:alpha-L-arabinofuranosidase C-terminal domain-containing protein [Balneolaceae bacterium]
MIFPQKQFNKSKDNFNPTKSFSAFLLFGILSVGLISTCVGQKKDSTGVAVMLVNTDRPMGKIDKKIYGHFLEHINHSVVDGLYAEEVRGRGFEGDDYKTYWNLVGDNDGVQLVDGNFRNGKKSIRLKVNGNTAGIRQGRFYLRKGYKYDGSVWIKPEEGSPILTFKVQDSDGGMIAEEPLKTSGSDWQEVPYSFTSTKTDTQATVSIIATGNGRVLVDYISLMRADVRKKGGLRPDLVNALKQLTPPFLRWPGGSFASIYRWKDGIGPKVSRVYHPNKIWGGYSDYYGFGTDEFMDLANRLDTEPLIALSATGTDPKVVDYAMDWVHYLNDPPTTKWGKRRAANGHSKPYDVKYFQIGNEPMNHGLSPEEYAKIVNVFGRRLRKIAPDAKIVACGQKRSNDMNWSKEIIEQAGDNFDILDLHNYEYESDLYETGLRRIRNYLLKLRDYVRGSDHPNIKLGVLEWNLSRTNDWRAGLHAAGSLIMYEEMGPEVTMACPALLMRNTTDDHTWSAFIYHNHVSWFPGSGYVVEKLFREHYAPEYLASTRGTFSDLKDRGEFFDNISTMKPRDWKPNSVDAIATGSKDGKRIVIKAVNYDDIQNTLLTRLQGSSVPQNADVKVYKITSGLHERPTMEDPHKLDPVEGTMAYKKNMTITLPPYTVVVVEITAKANDD